VQENYWPGWRAQIDGQPAPVRGARFMEVAVPAGAHTISLRYRPFDALFGIALCVLSLAWAVYLLAVKNPGVRNTTEAA
jgi:uncharacterized membrane protein YfhO